MIQLFMTITSRGFLNIFAIIASLTFSSCALSEQGNDGLTIYKIQGGIEKQVEYFYSGDIMPSRIIVQLKQSETSAKDYGTIENLIIKGCSGPKIEIGEKEKLLFTGRFYYLSLQTYEKFSKKCDTRQLKIFFVQKKRNHTGGEWETVFLAYHEGEGFVFSKPKNKD